MLPYYLALARQSFRTYLTYRAATIAGLLTNGFFGVLLASILIALFRYRHTVAGYSVQGMLQYTWFAQGMLAVVALWGWWEIALTIRSGDVITDLARPADYYLSWLCRDLGRAVYHLLFRGLPMVVVGLLAYGAQLPTLPTVPALCVSIVLAVVVSFAWRFLLNISAFWLVDVRGVGMLGLVLITFFSGFQVPLAFYPGWLHTVALVLPFQAVITAPTDIYLGRAAGGSVILALSSQLFWALLMSALCYLVLARARRRLEVQGG